MAQEILIVDDEADIRVLTSGILEDEGYQTRAAGTSAEALNAIETRRPNLILLDIWLQGSELDGLQILKVVRADHPSIPVLMMSGHGTIETAVAAIKDGAYDFIEKPFKADRLILLVERAIEAARLRRENEELRLRAGTEYRLVGDSKIIREVDQLIDRLAPTNSRVLISGPSGSGKEVAARLIHERSPRANAPFVVVNCATMIPDRMEVELFGTEEPGAGDESSGKVGTFEAAHNGTILLDEVSDMPLETQGKIVRVLQEQVFERVGGSTRVEVDVRVIATVTKDLAEEIGAGRFREDLFYRLNVVPIELPPLSARREDIDQLAKYFLKRECEAVGQPVRAVADDALAALHGYNWPGNVRELRNVIERMLILAPGDPSTPLSAAALPHEVTGNGPAAQGPDNKANIMAMSLRDAREVFERDYLAHQIERFDGNISKTAEFIGMERTALHRKLKSLGVQVPDRAATSV